MNDNDAAQFVPDGEAGGDGAEFPLSEADAASAAAQEAGEPATVAEAVPDELTSDPQVDAADEAGPVASVAPGDVLGAKISELEELARERTADLQRLQAEYANYKRRVDRDRDVARTRGIEQVVLDLLPVLDSIEAAKAHDELTGGFKLVADELEKVGAKHGLSLYGAPGDAFDPQIHDALMQAPYDGEHDVTVVATVMAKGAKLGDHVIRPARVGVAEPQ